MDEFAFIDELRRRLPLAEGALALADDAAVWEGLVITVDALVEDVHFVSGWSTAADAGWKAAAVNLSDLAAMGAEPVGLLWVVGVPEGRYGDALEAADGLGACARRFGAPILGGDTVGAPCLILSITALGRAESPVRRAGGKVGDLVGMTGPVGGAAAGLALLRGLEVDLDPPVREALLTRHRRPEPRLGTGRTLGGAGVTSMIDVSDGLGADLGHLARAGGVAIRLEDVPLQPGVEAVAGVAGEDPASFGLRGGDDYELAFTFPEEARAGVEATGSLVIGRVEPGEGVTWRGTRVDRLGWRHGETSA